MRCRQATGHTKIVCAGLFRIERLPRTGECIRTRVKLLGEAFGMSLVETESFIDGVRIAGGQIKIFIQED